MEESDSSSRKLSGRLLSVCIVTSFMLSALSVVAVAAVAETNWVATLPDPSGNNGYLPDHPLLQSRVVGGSGATELSVAATLLQTHYEQLAYDPGNYFESRIMPLISIDTLGTIGYNVQYDFSGGLIGAPSKLFQPDLSNNKGTVIQFPAPAVGQDPFYFPYYGYSYSSFFLSENGFITFGQSSNNPAAPPQSSFPNSAAPDCVIAALWADIATTQGQVWAGFSSDPWWTDTFSIIWQIPGGISFMLSLREDGAIIIQYWNIGGFAGSPAGYENLYATQGARLSSSEVVSNSRIIIYPTPGSYQYIDHVDVSVNKLSGGSNDGLAGIYFDDPVTGSVWSFPALNLYTPDQYAPPYGVLTEDAKDDMRSLLGAVCKFGAFVPIVGTVFAIGGVLITLDSIMDWFMPEYVPPMSSYSNSPYGVSGPATAELLANDWFAKPVYTRTVPQTFYVYPVIDWRIWDINRNSPHSLTIDVSTYVIDGGNYDPLNPDENYQHNAYTLTASQLVFGFNKGDAAVRVLSPNGGESWAAGTTHAITWDAGTGNTPLASLGPLVNIDLVKGTTPTRIASDVPNTGSYSWTLPTDIAAGTDYKITVSSKWMRNTDTNGQDLGYVSDTSNAAFTITNPYIYLRVTSPNGGELDWANYYLDVYFTKAGIGDYDHVWVYLYKGSTQVFTIAETFAITGYVYNIIPGTIASGTDYRVKVVAEANPNVYDFSDGYFTIGNNNDAWFAITSPNGGEYWLPGETHLITWTSGNIFEGNVWLRLYSGGVPSADIAVVPNTGSYLWTIPNNGYHQIGGPQCLMYIFSYGSAHYQNLGDFSDGYFEIDGSWKDVWYPDATTYVSPGGPCYIQWQENNYPGDAYVNIDLYKGGVFYSNIASSVSNWADFYQWNVPANQEIGNDYSIKVSSTAKHASDMSEVFSIASIDVTYPSGGETFAGGTTVPLTWACAYSPPGAQVIIGLYKGGTRLNYAVTEDDGYCDFGLAAPTPGSDYFIQISGYGTSDFRVGRSAYFTVGETATLTVTYPNGGESLQTWGSCTITWTSTGVWTAGVDIWLSGAQNVQLVDNTPNDGSYAFNIPCVTSGWYEVIIVGSDPAYSNIVDWSDQMFYITHEHGPTMPGIPHLQTPGDEADGVYMLEWDPATDDDSTPLQYYYIVENSKVNGVWSGWHDISQTWPTNSISLMRSPGEYYYAVCAVDTAGHWTSSWATMRPFPPFNEIIVVPAPLYVTGTASAMSGVAPLAVMFTCTPSGGSSPYTYSWAFGDGATSTEQNPTHVYNNPGKYIATVTVTDAASHTAQWSSAEINVIKPLTLQGSATPTSGTVPLSVSFTMTPDGGTTPYSYSWSFGDGGTSTSQNPTHVYSTTGTYGATCVVTDSGGQTKTWNSPTITVQAQQTYQLTINAGYYGARNVWYPLSGSAWVDATSGTTGVPFSVSGGSHSVRVQDPIVVGKKTYYFQQWQGGVPSTNPGTITVSGTTTLTAVFSTTPPPSSGFAVTVKAYYYDGSQWKTLTSAWVKIDNVQVGKTGSTFTGISAGTHKLEVQGSLKIGGKTYVFSYYGGGTPSTNPGTINVQSDMTVSAYYVLQGPVP